MAERELVFDVGMNNGDDTAYYLFRGHRVVAVEANPALCEAAERRFPNEISDGRLTIENVGVAESEGELEFWVSTQSEWSSFMKENAIKGGARAVARTVPTTTFRQLLHRHGIPKVLKVDIEGNDRLCLAELADFDPPEYLSFELSLGPFGGDDLLLAADVGYRSFRCVRQNDFRRIGPNDVPTPLAADLRRRIGRNRVTRRLFTRPLEMNGWEFRRGSSGPLPDELTGEWYSLDDIVDVWDRLRKLNGGWYDIHARTGPA
jgi:FkbM family methyltransferase